MINLPLCIINQQMFQHILTQQQPNYILEGKGQREKRKSLPVQNRQFRSFQQCCLFLSRNTKFQFNLPSSLEPTPPCFHLDLWPVKWGIKAEESFQGPLVQPSHMQMPRVIPFLNPPLAPSSHELYCLHPSARRLMQNLKALINRNRLLVFNLCLLAAILAPGNSCAKAVLQFTQLFTSPLYSFDICRWNNHITSQPSFCQIKQAKQAFYFLS